MWTAPGDREGGEGAALAQPDRRSTWWRGDVTTTRCQKERAMGKHMG
ncbi:MAG: hypothetical protein VXW29_02005 [SAR324 cluster bacterium]|nr:hypothetical protein [SAR324 cluster bacterium]